MRKCFYYIVAYIVTIIYRFKLVLILSLFVFIISADLIFNTVILIVAYNYYVTWLFFGCLVVLSLSSLAICYFKCKHRSLSNFLKSKDVIPDGCLVRKLRVEGYDIAEKVLPDADILSAIDRLLFKKTALMIVIFNSIIILIGLMCLSHFQLVQPMQDKRPWVQCSIDATKIQETKSTIADTLHINYPITISQFDQFTPYEAALYYATHWEDKNAVTKYYEALFDNYVIYLDYDALKPIHDLLVETPLSGRTDSLLYLQRERRLKEIEEELKEQREILLQYFNEEVANNVKFALDSALYSEAEQLIDDYKGNFLFGHWEVILGKGLNFLAAKWFSHIGNSKYTNQLAFIDYIGIFNEILTKYRSEALQEYLPGIKLQYSTDTYNFKFFYPFTDGISNAANTFIHSSNQEDGRDMLLDIVGFIPGIGTAISIGASGLDYI